MASVFHPVFQTLRIITRAAIKNYPELLLAASTPKEEQQSTQQEDSRSNHCTHHALTTLPPCYIADETFPVIEMGKWLIFGNLHAQKCTQRLPSLFNVIDQQFICWNTLLHLLSMLIKERDGMIFVLEFTVKGVLPDKFLYHESNT